MQTTCRNNYSFLIGKEIRERRKTIGMTQMELAEKSSLSTVYIGRVERGQIPLQYSTSIGYVRLLIRPFILFLRTLNSHVTPIESALQHTLKKYCFTY